MNSTLWGDGRRLRVSAVLGSVLWSVLCAVFTVGLIIDEERGDRTALQKTMALEVAAVVERLDGEFHAMANLAKVFALQPGTARLLDELEPGRSARSVLGRNDRQSALMANADAREESAYLQQVVESTNYITALIIDRSGIGVANSIWQGSQGLLGWDYNGRAYFHDAMEHGSGSQFAVGMATGIPSIFFSEAVVQDGHHLGVAVIRQGIEALTDKLAVPGAAVLVSDENGMIIAANRPEWVLHYLALSGRPKPEGRPDIYGPSPLQESGLSPDPDNREMLRWQGGDWLATTQSLHQGRLTAWLLRPYPHYETSRRLWAALGLLAAVAGIFLVALIERTLSAAISSRRHAADLGAANRTLEQALKTERRMVEDQRQFLHMLGHEVGTPLAIIDRAAEMVLDLLEPAPEQVARRLKAIRDSVRRLSRVIDGLLEAERVGLGGRMTLLDAGEIVAEVVSGLEAGRNRVVIEGPENGYPVLGDWTLMTMVIANLVDNALKYSPADQQVEIGIQSEEGDISITVADHGIGFPEAELSSAGQRFFRASNAGERRGTGLGLHIAARVLAIHQGRLDICNRPEGGALVTAHLPRADQPTNRIAPVQV